MRANSAVSGTSERMAKTFRHSWCARRLHKNLQDRGEGSNGRADDVNAVPFIAHQQHHVVGMPDAAAPSKNAALANVLQSYVGDGSHQVVTLVFRTTHGSKRQLCPLGLGRHSDGVENNGALPLGTSLDADFWVEPRTKKIGVLLACLAWCVKTIKDAYKSSVKVPTLTENITWNHRFDPRGEHSLKLNIYQLKLKRGAELGPFYVFKASGTDDP